MIIIYIQIMSTSRSPPTCRIRFVIPSGTVALSERSFFICVLISVRVGRVLSCGSGMCESEGWGASKSACTRVASSSSQGEAG